MNTTQVNSYSNMQEAATKINNYVGKLGKDISEIDTMIKNLNNSDIFVGPACDELISEWNRAVFELYSKISSQISFASYLTSAKSNYEETDKSSSSNIMTV